MFTPCSTSVNFEQVNAGWDRPFKVSKQQCFRNTFISGRLIVKTKSFWRQDKCLEPTVKLLIINTFYRLKIKVHYIGRESLFCQIDFKNGFT